MKRYGFTSWLSAALAFLYASAAFAMDEAVEETGELAEHGAEHSSGGLPQLDPTWFASQIFWLVVTFIFLYAVFSRRVLPALSRVLESRQSHVQRDLDAAEKLKTQAETALKAYEETMDQARAQASGIFHETESRIKAQAAQQIDALRVRAQKEIQQAEAAVEQAKKKAMNDLNTIAAEIASLAAQKIVGISADLDQAKTVVQNLNKEAA